MAALEVAIGESCHRNNDAHFAEPLCFVGCILFRSLTRHIAENTNEANYRVDETGNRIEQQKMNCATDFANLYYYLVDAVHSFRIFFVFLFLKHFHIENPLSFTDLNTVRDIQKPFH